MPIFGGIREDVIDFLLSLARKVSVPRGEYFFHEKDPGDSMFILEKGKVVVLKDWKGQQHVLEYLTTGDCFGEMAVIDLLPRSASILADEDCEAIEISAAHLYKIYERSVEQFALIQMNMARELSRRLRLAHDWQFRVEAERRGL
jgi:CRP-like cAMP-binding protein